MTHPDSAARSNAALIEELIRTAAPRTGGWMPLFLLEAIEQYCEKVRTTDEADKTCDPAVMDPAAWRACAEDVQQIVDRWKLWDLDPGVPAEPRVVFDARVPPKARVVLDEHMRSEACLLS